MTQGWDIPGAKSNDKNSAQTNSYLNCEIDQGAVHTQQPQGKFAHPQDDLQTPFAYFQACLLTSY